MIQHPIPTVQDLSWQEELKALITEPEELLKQLNLSMEYLPRAHAASRLFPLRVTPSFVARMRRSDIDDPLLKQVLPIGEELEKHSAFNDDPIEESQFMPVKGVIHKYRSRILVIGTTSCAINCRYCFRRAFDYTNNRLSRDDWENIFTYVRSKPDVDEVILSGGDPLMQSDQHFEWLTIALAKIKQIKRLRIHSRLPIVLPSRLSPELIHTLSSSRLHTLLVVHSNHPNEIDASVQQQLQNTSLAGVTVLNQTVLLKGINDDLRAQAELVERLFECKVLPYYLHMLDRVTGAGHFEVEESDAMVLYQRMQATLPGYLLPKLVRDEAGKEAKTIVFPPQ